MEENRHISSEEINGLVQHEAENEEYIQLDEERIEKIQNHLFHCEDCNKQYVLSKKAYVEIASEFEKKESNKAWYWVAAAAVLVLSFYWLKPSNAYQDEMLQETASVKKDTVRERNKTSELAEIVNDEPDEVEPPKPNHQLLAANFEPNEELEALINNPLRSESLKIIKPMDREKLKDNIQFEWSSQEDVQLTLKVMGNQENVVHQEQVKNGTYKLNRPLSPGRYYWSLENEKEVLFYGAFLYKYE